MCHNLGFKEVVKIKIKSWLHLCIVQLFRFQIVSKIKRSMKNIRLITIALLTAFIITGCDENGNQTIIGTGDVESMEVDLPAFE